MTSQRSWHPDSAGSAARRTCTSPRSVNLIAFDTRLLTTWRIRPGSPDAEAGTLMGSDTGLIIAIGQRVTVRLTEATPVTGGLELELLSLDDKALPRAPGPSGRRGGGGGGGGRRKSTSARPSKDKSRRKVARRRK